MTVQVPRRTAALLLLPLLSLAMAGLSVRADDTSVGVVERKPIPEGLVVLTFDDSVQSHFTVVRPLLLEHGFGATFFITEGWDFATNKRDYMTWEQIAQLHKDGFEIGNHTRDHLGISHKTVEKLDEQLTGIEDRCAQHGIPKPVSFAWPGNAFSELAFPILSRHGIRFARRGGGPEYAYAEGRGMAFEPGPDHPLLLPSAGDSRPTWRLDNFVQAVDQAKNGRIAILQFHGVPDTAHNWVSTPQQQFEAFLKHLKDWKCKVIALRDLANYIDPTRAPDNAEEVIDRRKVEAAARIAALDEELGALWPASQPVPAAADIPAMEGVQRFVIAPHAPQQDGLRWRHGVSLAWHNGRLFASFGANRGAENTAGEEAHYRVSEDGGQTWGPVGVIDAGAEPGLAISHGVLLSTSGQLWAFQGAFFNRLDRVHGRAYRFDEAAGKWQPRGMVVQFWPMQEPQRQSDGNWIMAGLRVANGFGGPDDPPVVAISRGDDVTQWTPFSIPGNDTLEAWGECALLQDGPELLCVSRWKEPTALTSVSRDHGRTWTRLRASRLPMAASKPAAGTLSTGQRYLIGTIASDTGNRRSPLTIAVTRPGEKQFHRVWKIREAVLPASSQPSAGSSQTQPAPESHPQAALAYPSAIEHDGKLFIGYSNSGGRPGNQNSIELAVVPVSALSVEPQEQPRK